MDRAGSDTEVVHGRGIAPGRAGGVLRRNRPDAEPAEFGGAVLLLPRADPDDAERLVSSAAALTDGAPSLSHIAALARELGRPVVDLGGARGVRVLPAGQPGLLSISRAGTPGDRMLLGEGDVVIVDGGEATLTCPGGMDARSRAVLRRVHALVADCLAGERGEGHVQHLLRSMELGGIPAIELVLDVLVLCDRGEWTMRQRLFERLRSRPSLSSTVAGWCARVEPGLRARGSRRLARARAGVATAKTLDELRLRLAAAREQLAAHRWRLDRIGAEAADPDAAREIDDEAATVRASLARRAAEALRRLSELDEQRLLHHHREVDETVRTLGPRSPMAKQARALKRRLRRVVAGLPGAGSAGVIALDAVTGLGPESVGGKAAGLAGLAPFLPEWARIPAGLVIPAQAHRLHLHGEPERKIRAALAAGPSVAALSRRARAAVLGSPVPRPVTEGLEAIRSSPTRRWAVRSSAALESGAGASLAGLFDTVLGVFSTDLERAVRRVWASLWNRRALEVLASQQVSPLDVPFAVLVQESVATRAAGVLALRETARGEREILVNATWGLGEGISRGEAVGDLYRLDHAGRTLELRQGHPRTAVALEPSRAGTRDVPLDAARRQRPCLDPGERVRLAGLGPPLARTGGSAWMVEFGFDDEGTLWIFQARGLSGGAAAWPALAGYDNPHGEDHAS